MGQVIGLAVDLISERREPSTKISALIVGLTGVVSGLPFLLYMNRASRNLGNEAIMYVFAGQLFGVASLIAFNYLLWVFFTGSFYTIATLVFNREGEFRRLLRLVGWSFVGLLSYRTVILIRDVVLYVAWSPGETRTAGVPPIVFTLIGLVGSLCVLCSVVLWVLSVYRTFYMDVKRAIVTVSIPLVFTAVIFVAPRIL